MKGFLSRNGVRFGVKLLTDPAHRAELARRGTGAAPLTLVGDQAIFGFDQARLNAMLGQAGLLGEAHASAAPDPVRLDAQVPLAEALAIASFHGDAVVFVHSLTGRYLGPSLQRSSVAVPGRPISVAACPPWGTIAVVRYEGGGVTMLDARDGSYLHGDADSSSSATGALPLHALAHPEEPLLYVSNSESRSLTLLDPRSGACARGTLARSTISVPGQPGVMVLQREADRLHVRLREGAVLVLDARTLEPARGSMRDSCFEVGRGRGLALSHDERILYVPETLDSHDDALALFDARTCRPLFGTRERSRFPTAPTPLAIATHPSRSIVYVSCFGAQVVELRDGETGAYLHGSAAASSVSVGSGARALLIDGRDDIAHVTSFDEATLFSFDAQSGAPRFREREAPTLPLGPGPRGMALL